MAPPPAGVGAAAPNPAASRSGPDVLLEVVGIGRSQLAVSQHVLRLEQTGLFSKVNLIDTGREPFLNTNAIGFRIQCVFGETQQHPHDPVAKQPQAVTAVETGGINR